jgi:hypothetical protein
MTTLKPRPRLSGPITVASRRGRLSRTLEHVARHRVIHLDPIGRKDAA